MMSITETPRSSRTTATQQASENVPVQRHGREGPAVGRGNTAASAGGVPPAGAQQGAIVAAAGGVGALSPSELSAALERGIERLDKLIAHLNSAEAGKKTSATAEDSGTTDNSTTMTWDEALALVQELMSLGSGFDELGRLVIENNNTSYQIEKNVAQTEALTAEAELLKQVDKLLESAAKMLQSAVMGLALGLASAAVQVGTAGWSIKGLASLKSAAAAGNGAGVAASATAPAPVAAPASAPTPAPAAAPAPAPTAVAAPEAAAKASNNSMWRLDSLEKIQAFQQAASAGSSATKGGGDYATGNLQALAKEDEAEGSKFAAAAQRHNAQREDTQSNVSQRLTQIQQAMQAVKDALDAKTEAMKAITARG